MIGLTVLPILLLADMDRCVSCHGVDFEKKALGVSKIVKNMSEAEIKKSLDGYKMGKGGSMKEVMFKEVNVGVDTDAMAADVYNEIHTPGFEEPDAEFIFKKRRSVRNLFNIKQAIKKADKKSINKAYSKMKSFAFDIYSYNSLVRESVGFSKIKPAEMPKDKVLESVAKVKSCVDHSFTDEALTKCQVDFINLSSSIALTQAEKLKLKIKPKDKSKTENK